jgi:hypothetical protein
MHLIPHSWGAFFHAARAGLRKLNLVWTDITDDTLRAISNNLPHLTAL